MNNLENEYVLEPSKKNEGVSILKCKCGSNEFSVRLEKLGGWEEFPTVVYMHFKCVKCNSDYVLDAESIPE